MKLEIVSPNFPDDLRVCLGGIPLTDAENAEAAAFVECMRRGWMVGHGPGGWSVRCGEWTGLAYTGSTLSEALTAAIAAQSDGPT